jgi:hypothetical protein
MPTTSVRRRHLLVHTFLGIVGPDLTPDLLREGGERQQVRAGILQMVGETVVGNDIYGLDRDGNGSGCE